MALITARRTLATLLNKTLSSSTASSSSSSFSTLSSRSRFALHLVEKVSSTRTGLGPCYITTRPKTSGSGYSPLNDPSPNWSNRPPKETILLDGCDYEHWLIVMEFTDPKPTEEEMINAYVNTLSSVVGRQISLFIWLSSPFFPLYRLCIWDLMDLRFVQRGGGKEEDLLGLHFDLHWLWCFDLWRAFLQSQRYQHVLLSTRV